VIDDSPTIFDGVRQPGRGIPVSGSGLPTVLTPRLSAP
jgi:hypothetical protein